MFENAPSANRARSTNHPYCGTANRYFSFTSEWGARHQGVNAFNNRSFEKARRTFQKKRWSFSKKRGRFSEKRWSFFPNVGVFLLPLVERDFDAPSWRTQCLGSDASKPKKKQQAPRKCAAPF